MEIHLRQDSIVLRKKDQTKFLENDTQTWVIRIVIKDGKLSKPKVNDIVKQVKS